MLAIIRAIGQEATHQQPRTTEHDKGLDKVVSKIIELGARYARR